MVRSALPCSAKGVPPPEGTTGLCAQLVKSGAAVGHNIPLQPSYVMVQGPVGLERISVRIWRVVDTESDSVIGSATGGWKLPVRSVGQAALVNRPFRADFRLDATFTV